MFNSGRSTYVLASVLAIIIHAGLAALLIAYHDEIANIQLLEPEPLKLTLVQTDLQPIDIKSIQSKLIIEKAPPKPVVKPARPTPKKVTPKKTKAKKKKTQPKKPKPKKKKPQPDPLDTKLKQIKQTQKPQAQETQIPDSPELKVAKRYVARIQKQIEKNWTKPLNVQYQEMAGLKVLIRLLLSQEGRLEKAQIIQSSGNSQFDRSALNAVRRTGQFQVPGDVDVFEKYFRHLTISYNL